MLVALAEVPPGLAGVVRHLQEHVDRVDPLGVLRVDEQLLVVHRLRAVVGALLPGLAAVLRAEGAGRLVGGGGLDERVDGVGLGGRDREADAAHLVLRQAARDLAPALAAVGRLVEARLGAAVDQREDVAPPLPRGGEQHVGIARVHDDVAHARVLADREHGRPGLAAVRRLVEAAVAAGRPERALRRDVDGVAVLRVDQDPADVLGALEPHVLPALAAVLALVDAVAVADAALRVVLAAAHPDDARVPGVDRDAADRGGALAVEDRRPAGAGILGAPDAARGDRDEPAPLVGGIDGEVGDAAAGDGRPDAAQGQPGPGVGGPGNLGLVLVFLFGVLLVRVLLVLVGLGVGFRRRRLLFSSGGGLRRLGFRGGWSRFGFCRGRSFGFRCWRGSGLRGGGRGIRLRGGRRWLRPGLLRVAGNGCRGERQHEGGRDPVLHVGSMG